MYPTKKLGEISKIQNGFAFKSSDYVKFSNTLNFRMSNIRPGGGLDLEHNKKYLPDIFTEKYNNFLLNDGDIVIAMTDMATDPKILAIPTIVKLDNKKLLLNQRVGRFIDIDLSNLNTDYLKYILITPKIREELVSMGGGGVQINISTKQILSIKIPLPPLSTQKLIVQKLDSAFENIDKNINLTKENLKNLEELNKSVLEKVFSEGEYEKVDLIKIASFSNKTTLPKDGDLYNYIGLENIESNTGKLVNFKETLGKEIRSNKVIFKNGMVLYGKLRPYLNKVIVSEFDGVATTEILPIECTDKIYNYYLGYFLRTDYFVNLANINISGARMPRVTTKFLKEEIQIPLPPLQKQKEIVSYLDEVFEKNKELKTKYEEQLKELEELKQSLLKDAFDGKLVKD